MQSTQTKIIDNDINVLDNFIHRVQHSTTTATATNAQMTFHDCPEIVNYGHSPLMSFYLE